MPGTPLAYRALVRVADLLLPLAAPWSPKLAAGDRGRRGAVERWRAWASRHRDRRRPLLWVHASSVGEGLQAEAVLATLRPGHPDWQIVVTFFSPSAVALAARQPADQADYLPYDTVPNVDAMLALLAPAAVVFTKLDLWPELATRAAAAGVRVGMIAATVSPVSGRTRPVARALTRNGYAAITAAGAIAAADAEALASLGTDPIRIEVLGDPRFDSALARARAVPPDWPWRRLTAGAATLVAGSTWEPDHQILLAAWPAVLARHPGARLVLVPHEPTPDHLTALDATIRAGRSSSRRLSQLGEQEAVPALVVVDRIGILAGLYREAAIGYVGGGFGNAGLHSVLEPAACGIPVVTGPDWQSSREAGLLFAAGAGEALPRSPADAVARLAALWSDWLSDGEARDRAGRAALRVVEEELGAAGRNAALIERLMTVPAIAAG